MLHLNNQQADFLKIFQDRLAFEPSLDAHLMDSVRSVLADVRRQGDEAVLRYTGQWDGLSVTSMQQLEVPSKQLQEAFNQLDDVKRNALQTAAHRIQVFHEAQKQSSWSMDDGQGSVLGQRVTPIDRAGLYVPGGKAAYPSSVLMNAIPAKVAGVRELIMVVPTPGGERNDLVLAAAHLAGVDRVFTIGGAQAIGALAYGTQTVPAVDKIVGPGNAYVAEAKRQVFGRVGIDMIAGPSEILVISDGSVSPQWVAMDLFSQAEHDEMAQSILLSSDPQHSLEVLKAIEALLPEMPRRSVIEKSLADRGLLVDVRSLEEACELATLAAPEHLEILTSNPEHWAEKIRHAGAIFMGPFASESLGDYCAGPNHVLPTMRSARFSSPLGVYDFQKRTSMLKVSEESAQALGAVAAELAWGEGLAAHARAAELRMQLGPKPRY
ncbi:MAG: histidinol dehydrogenase [Bordetella sp.]